MTQPPQRLSTYGAVDLSAFKQPTPPPSAAGPAGSSAENGSVVDVTEATFEAEVIARSTIVPVVIDFWAEWCAPCKQLSPLLERLAAEADGRWLLAKIDVDANQRLAGAAGVQSIPLVLGVIAGQAVPLFTGALPETEVRRYLDELMQVALTNGVTGRLTSRPDGVQGVAGDPPAPPIDPYNEAMDLLVQGDFAGASAAYGALLARNPGDADAARGLALVDLGRRVEDLDAGVVLARAAEHAEDIDAQTQAADLEVANGDIEAAFRRLVDAVRRSTGDDRDRARTHLVGLFTALGSKDPRVAAARTALANALF